ncbi:MAG: ABC transporter substrate binding protein [Candidatus Rickettsia vulgarisii]
MIVGVATILAQSFVKYAKENKTKLVFSSVTDPIKTGLVQNLRKPGNNTSEVSNFIELEPQIKLFKQIQPNLKRLGFLYNPSDTNSLSLITKLEELCPKLDIKLILQSANKTSEVAQAATKLAENVDAIFISNDNTALSALQVIISASNKVKIPIYVSDTQTQ